MALAKMRWAVFSLALVGGLAISTSSAQKAADTQQPQGQSAPADPNQKPKSTQEANPFPEDTNSVPVMPSATSPGSPEPAAPAAENLDYGDVPLPGDLSDPVRSPDEAAPLGNTAGGGSSSSSGMDDLLKAPPEDEKAARRHKGGNDEEPAAPKAGPKEDESVGSYYLETRNWKGALSRFESALVLDPENPDVYWGLAEAQRHLGDFANSKANYQKLIDYDPDSKHGKEAKKLIKSPELANAPTVSQNAPAVQPQQQ